MLQIKDDVLSMIKGDSANLAIELSDYEYSEGDTLTLTVKKSLDEEEIIFSHTVPANEAIGIFPEDTNNVKAGRYFYDVQLDMVNGNRITVINPSFIVFMEGVTND